MKILEKDLFLFYFYLLYINIIFLFVENTFLSNSGTGNSYIYENHIPNQSFVKESFNHQKMWLCDNYMFLNPGRYCCLTIVLNATENEFILRVGGKARSIRNCNQFLLDLLIPCETIMQKGCK